MDKDRYCIEAENSLVFFLLALQKLELYTLDSMALLLLPNMSLRSFVNRNQHYLRKPDGILVL